ncbi:hypothetical protein ACOMHN_049222 [Nucella lapillus]
MVSGFLDELNRAAKHSGFPCVVYLSYDDFDSQHQHALADQRREARGGFDRFPEDPFEGDGTELCQKLYAAGEGLLWDEVFNVYQSKRWTLSLFFEIVRLRTTLEGLIDRKSAASVLLRNRRGVKREKEELEDC